MKKIMLSLFGLIFSISVYADSNSVSSPFSCIRMDGMGTVIHVIFYQKTMSVNINGDILKLAFQTRGDGLATENYVTNKGMLIYDSFIRLKNNPRVFLIQYNAVTNNALMQAVLACHEV